MLYKSINEVELNVIESCISLESYRYLSSISSLKVNIPKLMPFIPVARPSNSTVYVNTSILCNCSETMPRVRSTISSRNYITARKIRMPLYDQEVSFGEQFTCIFLNKNIKDVIFTKM